MRKMMFVIGILIFELLVGKIFAGSVGVEVSPNFWHVGTGGEGSWISPSTFTVKNIGTDPAKANIRATDSKNWLLSSSPGLDAFTIEFGEEPNWSPILTVDSEMLSKLDAGNTYGFYLRYQSPTEVSDVTLTETQYSTVTISVEPAEVIALEYELVRQWGGEGTGDGQFDAPNGIALDSSGNVYVVDSNNSRIQKFSPNGTFITKWGKFGTGNGEFINPWDIAVDKYDNVYVTEISNHRIQKFDSNGHFLKSWGSYGTGDGQFDGPRGITIDTSDHIYVVDYQNSRIQKFDLNGNFILKWGKHGLNEGDFAGPLSIATDSNDNVYVLQHANPQIRIQKFDFSGNYITSWGTDGTGDGEFQYPVAIAVDNLDVVYASDQSIYNYCIQKFDSNGMFIAKLENVSANFITIDLSGNLYVTENELVKVLAPKY